MHPEPDALQQRLALGMQIHTTLDTLNKTINQAIATRERLESAVAGQGMASDKARSAIAALDQAISTYVELDLHSSEGPLLHETKLRSHLAYLAADIDLSYAVPTPAEHQVFNQLSQEAQTGEAQLQDAIAQGQQVR